MVHARNNVRRWGGVAEDYVVIHDFLDGPKASHADVRFRAVLHHAWGISLCERVFGRELVNSDGRRVSVRDIAEAHVLEDLGRIPSLSEYLDLLSLEPWMAGLRQDRPAVKIVD